MQECCLPPRPPRSRREGRKGCLKVLARNDGVVRATMKIRQHTDHKRWNATEMVDWRRCILGSPPLKKQQNQKTGWGSFAFNSLYMFQRDVDDWWHSENIHSAEQSDTFSWTGCIQTPRFFFSACAAWTDARDEKHTLFNVLPIVCLMVAKVGCVCACTWVCEHKRLLICFIYLH